VEGEASRRDRFPAQCGQFVGRRSRFVQSPARLPFSSEVEEQRLGDKVLKKTITPSGVLIVVWKDLVYQVDIKYASLSYPSNYLYGLNWLPTQFSTEAT
jgi:hypothetical protein